MSFAKEAKSLTFNAFTQINKYGSIFKKYGDSQSSNEIINKNSANDHVDERSSKLL